MSDNIPIHYPSEWKLGKSLGEGNLSEGVYKAKKIDGKINNFDLPNNGKCVIKIIKVDNEKKLHIKECSIIDKLIEINDGLKGVIKYYGYAQYKNGDNEYIYIYMEYLKNYESIGKLLKEKKYIFSEEQIFYIGLKLLKYIKILHDNYIVHRDIKCNNVLLNLSNGKIKFIDFGISKHCESINKTGIHTFAGTPTHMAPEVHTSHRINKSDIWSIGCTLLEVLGADFNISANKIINDIEIKNIRLKLLIKHCLVVEPTSREYFIPSLEDKLFLKWVFQKFENSELNQGLLPSIASFNQPITPNLIPSSVTKRDLWSFYKSLIPDSIPSSEAKFDLSSFYQLITPSSVNELDIWSFYRSIKLNLISPIIKLYLSSFDQSITPNSIPSSVTKLDLWSSNQPITPNSIPYSVTELNLWSFDEPITPNSIPSSVTELNLWSFDQPITLNSIPSSVTKLDLWSFNQPITPNSIPSSVTELNLWSFDQPITLNSIPSSVTKLDLWSFNQPITPNSIPSSVTELNLESFNQPITPNSIPQSVTKLSLSSFNQTLDDNTIPPLVKNLKFDRFDLNRNCKDSLPDSILTFECNFKFGSPFRRVNYIPKKTSTLILRNYNQPITKESIPISVISLELGSDFKDFKSFINLPPSIITLKFGVVNCVDDDKTIKLLISKNIPDIQIKR